jgi:glucokinase
MALSHMTMVLALDIGGTKMAAAVVDERGEIRRRAQVPALGAHNSDELFARLSELATEMTADDSVIACGVGCGGPMAPGGETVSPLNIGVWREFPLRARLAEALKMPVWIDNDAKALALGESWAGAAQGVANFIAMVVSTGVGGGIVLDGRLLHGALGNAGHIGHVIVEPGGRPCVCGGRGCLEAEASGPSIRAAFGVEPADADLAIKQRTGILVGRAVASVANLLDLRLAVVAGSVALGFGAPFFEAAQAEMDQRARLDFSRGARIIPAGLGDHGPLIGAAKVAFDAMSYMT